MQMRVLRQLREVGVQMRVLRQLREVGVQRLRLSLAGAATSIIFVATKDVFFVCFFSDKHMFVATKHVFVATNIFFSLQTFVATKVTKKLQKFCRDKTCFSRQNTSFVATKINMFFRGSNTFVATKAVF